MAEHIIDLEIVIDCADPTRLGTFWAEALGYVEDPVPEGYSSWDQYDSEHDFEPNSGWGCSDPSGRRPNLFFQRVPEQKTVKNRIHLDLKVPDITAEEQRLTALGARRLEVVNGKSGNSWTVMLDPEDNEFCLLHEEK